MAADRPSPSEPSPAAGAAPACPSCGAAPGSTLACLACGAVLEEPEDASHFARLGLVPDAAFDADAAELTYLRLSRLLHPDHQADASPEVQERALRNIALLNEAWTVLNDDQERVEYLLEHHDPGALERHKKLSPAFLMEAMEISEELEEAHDTGCQDTIHRIAKLAQEGIDERMHGVASACSDTMERIAHEGHVHEDARPTRLLPPHDWNTEQIAVLLHQARVYRRILRDTGVRT